MISFISIIALGFFLGMRHATDPDHVIAVSTIVSRERNVWKSAWIGAFWGVGHTLTIFMVGAGIILFNLTIPTRFGLGMELAVGVMLVLLGVINVKNFFRVVPETAVHSHAHSHGDYVHTHPHTHGPEGHTYARGLAGLDRMMMRFGAYRPLRPFVIGLVHGLAGSAAVALLVLTAIRNPRWAVAYLLVFGVGTIAGMAVITMSIASALHLFRGSAVLSRRLAFASGLLSLGFGLLVTYQIGIVNGLFTAHPHWTPR